MELLLALLLHYGEIFDIVNRNGLEAVYTVQYSVNDGSVHGTLVRAKFLISLTKATAAHREVAAVSSSQHRNM